MGRSTISDITKQGIKRAWKAGEGSYGDLSARFNVPVGSIKRITKGIPKGSTTVDAVIEGAIATNTAIAAGASIRIGDLDLTNILQTGIKDLTDEMGKTPPTSKEGMANAALRWMECWIKLHPPTLEQAIENLLDRPDFDPQVFREVLNRHAQKTG